MNYFGKSTAARKIVLKPAAVDASHPELNRRLERIAENYSKLNAILDGLESRLELDPRLVICLDESNIKASKGSYQRRSIRKPR